MRKLHTNDEILEIGEKLRFLDWLVQESCINIDSEEAKQIVKRWVRYRTAQMKEFTASLAKEVPMHSGR